jgi:hypothetical protein
MSMNGEAIITVSAAVVALTQLLKWAGVPDKWGALVVVLLAAIGVAVWAFSQDLILERADLWPYFAGWIAVATSAAGVFGFTRAAASAVTAAKPPPLGGAVQNPTVDR